MRSVYVYIYVVLVFCIKISVIHSYLDLKAMNKVVTPFYRYHSADIQLLIFEKKIYAHISN